MICSKYIFLVALIAFLNVTFGQLSSNKEELLNWCLKSKNHKTAPGKEDLLHQQCSPWKDYACCTEEVTKDIHGNGIYNFTFDHCYSQTKRNMSAQCRKHFNQDNCFHECEPHIGLWVVETTRKISSERFFEVPLCAEDCDKWFEDCKNDFTCAHNWPRDFKFKNGYNTCKEDSKCLTFKQVYGTAKEFCESVWDHSWKYTPNDQPCIKVWFNESSGNPNKAVAEHYIDEYLLGHKGGANHLTELYSIWLLFFTLIYFTYVRIV